MLEYLPLACAAALTYVLVDWCRRQSRVTNLEQRYVFITGCDTGFGQALARRLDLLGFQVIAACMTEAGQVELRNTCTPRVKTVLLDVTDHASVQRAFEFAQIVIPVSQGLWALVNNAGVGPVSAGPLEWLSIEDFQKTLEVNTLGLIDVSLTFLPLLKKGKGRLVNMSASSGRLAGLHTLPTSVSKFGVEAFSDGLRQHLKISGCDVSVHVIEPGLFRTEGHNEATLCSVYESTWRRLPDAVRNNYDDLFYNEYQKYLKYTFRAMASPHVSMVIDAYEHALTADSPRMRYTVGSDAMFSILLSYLPSSIVDWIMCKSGPRLRPQSIKIRMSSKPTSL